MEMVGAPVQLKWSLARDLRGPSHHNCGVPMECWSQVPLIVPHVSSLTWELKNTQGCGEARWPDGCQGDRLPASVNRHTTQALVGILHHSLRSSHLTSLQLTERLPVSLLLAAASRPTTWWWSTYQTYTRHQHHQNGFHTLLNSQELLHLCPCLEADNLEQLMVICHHCRTFQLEPELLQDTSSCLVSCRHAHKKQVRNDLQA